MSRIVVPVFAAVVLCATATVSLPNSAAAQRGSPTQRVGIGARVRDTTQTSGQPKREEAPAPTMAPGVGAIVGVVVDSLHGLDPLAGAGVKVMQLPVRHAVTTDAGAFRIDSIPPGRYTVELTHPVLDSIGIRVVSDTIVVSGGTAVTTQLAVPSARTLAAAVCTVPQRRFGPGVIAGRVIDAVTGQPATGTEVSVAWTETEVGRSIGVQSVPHLRKATAAADGTYRICGVPDNFRGSLQAIRGAAKTAEVPIEIAPDDPFAVRVMYLPPPPAPANAVASAQGGASQDMVPVKRPTAVITGKVTNAGGVPVENARVSVQGAVVSTATNRDGSFTLAGVPPGTQSVLVRRVGYTPVELPLDVAMHAPNRITVRLGTYTPQLSSVEVKAKAKDPLETTGFSRREKSGMGRYLTPDQIDNIHPSYTSDALRRIAGLYVSGSGYSASVTTTRGNGCVRYLVDGSPVNADAGQSIDELVGANDLAAVEFYNVADIPMELSSGMNSGCALLVIWTKGQLRDKDVRHR